MVAKPLCPLYKNIIKPLDRARYPELRYVYAKDRILTANMGAIGINKSYEQTFIKVLLSSCSCNANIYKSICL